MKHHSLQKVFVILIQKVVQNLPLVWKGLPETRGLYSKTYMIGNLREKDTFCSKLVSFSLDNKKTNTLAYYGVCILQIHNVLLGGLSANIPFPRSLSSMLWLILYKHQLIALHAWRW